MGLLIEKYEYLGLSYWTISGDVICIYANKMQCRAWHDLHLSVSQLSLCARTMTENIEQDHVKTGVATISVNVSS
jgi:hypothetical protein